jgi:uncharacterized protein
VIRICQTPSGQWAQEDSEIEGAKEAQVIYPEAATELGCEIFREALNELSSVVTDAHLAALAIEHGAELNSCDSDFSRFSGLRWVNPLPS